MPGEETSQEEWRKKLRASPVRVQWDPERDISMRSLSYRSIQIGLSGEAVGRYVDEWIVSVTDVTATMRLMDGYLETGDVQAAKGCLPEETPFVLPEDLQEYLKMK